MAALSSPFPAMTLDLAKTALETVGIKADRLSSVEIKVDYLALSILSSYTTSLSNPPHFESTFDVLSDSNEFITIGLVWDRIFKIDEFLSFMRSRVSHHLGDEASIHFLFDHFNTPIGNLTFKALWNRIVPEIDVFIRQLLTWQRYGNLQFIKFQLMALDIERALHFSDLELLQHGVALQLVNHFYGDMAPFLKAHLVKTTLNLTQPVSPRILEQWITNPHNEDFEKFKAENKNNINLYYKIFTGPERSL